MPARSRPLFHCFCSECTLECGYDSDDKPRGKYFPAAYRTAHLASIQSRSVDQSAEGPPEQAISSDGQDVAFSSDAQDAEDTTSSSEAASNSDIQITSDKRNSSERSILASMSKLSLYPPSSPAGRAAAKREASRRTTKYHEILDRVERRVNESLRKVSDPDFDLERVPAFLLEIGHIQKAFDRVKGNIKSVIDRKSLIQESLESLQESFATHQRKYEELPTLQPLQYNSGTIEAI